MPKVQVASGFGDDEEKTTIESGWEEEPSTTVEQGEVADRIRSLGTPRSNNTGVTNTNAQMLDEPTVDDQRANAALSLLTPAALTVQARIVIIAGNDSGNELTVAPGKSYTIGRAIDNDFVLTDIAVSRKHFDLRYEHGAWVVADRGSGNGTVVNGAIEDAPFVLANGDTIEIGNTQFRIDIPGAPGRNAAARNAAARAAMDMPLDEDEPSTVASKPLREDAIAPEQLPVPTPPMFSRPKTVPPPMPMRARSVSAAPPMHSQPMLGAQTMPPGATSPLDPSAYANPMQSVSTPMRGSGVGPSMGQPLPMNQPMGAGMRPHGTPLGAPTMLGDAMGLPLQQMHQMQGHNMHQPSPASTIPGQGMPLAPSQLPPNMFGYPSGNELPRQQAPHPNGHHPSGHHPNGQMVIINGVAVRDATSTALVPPTPYNGMPHVMVPQQHAAPILSRRMKLIFGGAGLTVLAAIATVAIIKGGSDDKKPVTAKSADAKTNTTVTPIEDKKADPKPTIEPKVDTKPTIAKVETKPTVEVKPTVEPKIETKPEPKIETKPEPKVETKPEPKIEKKVEPKVEKKKTEPKAEKKKTEPKVVEKKEPAEPKTTKRVAADTSGAKNKADEQYRAKQFAAAAATLKAAAKGADEDEVRELNSMASIYQQFGAAYNVGMAPGTNAKEAFEKLNKARGFDNSAGKAYSSDINDRLAQVAPKAAVGYLAAKDFVSAKKALSIAESTGGKNGTTADVRAKLELEAGKLFKIAEAELATDASAAKEKLRSIRSMVDATSPWAAKAQSLLNKN